MVAWGGGAWFVSCSCLVGSWGGGGGAFLQRFLSKTRRPRPPALVSFRKKQDDPKAAPQPSATNERGGTRPPNTRSRQREDSGRRERRPPHTRRQRPNADLTRPPGKPRQRASTRQSESAADPGRRTEQRSPTPKGAKSPQTPKERGDGGTRIKPPANGDAPTKSPRNKDNSEHSTHPQKAEKNTSPQRGIADGPRVALARNAPCPLGAALRRACAQLPGPAV